MFYVIREFLIQSMTLFILRKLLFGLQTHISISKGFVASKSQFKLVIYDLPYLLIRVNKNSVIGLSITI